MEISAALWQKTAKQRLVGVRHHRHAPESLALFIGGMWICFWPSVVCRVSIVDHK